MKEALYKPVDVEGLSGLWGFYNTPHEKLTASKDGYLLTVAPKHIWRLDDFTPAEEKAFWDFTFAKAAEGVNDPAKRGLKDNLDDKSTNTVLCALNDGPVAWQGVGTVHGHVIWNKQSEPFENICERLIIDRTKFSGGEKVYIPVGMTAVDLSRESYAQDIRDMRRLLRESFLEAGTPAEETGFSLYTEKAYAEDPRKSGSMVIELWSRDHHSLSSLSQWVRYWNGLWDNPVLGDRPTGLQYGEFRPEPAL